MSSLMIMSFYQCMLYFMMPPIEPQVRTFVSIADVIFFGNKIVITDNNSFCHHGWFRGSLHQYTTTVNVATASLIGI